MEFDLSSLIKPYSLSTSVKTWRTKQNIRFRLQISPSQYCLALLWKLSKSKKNMEIKGFQYRLVELCRKKSRYLRSNLLHFLILPRLESLTKTLIFTVQSASNLSSTLSASLSPAVLAPHVTTKADAALPPSACRASRATNNRRPVSVRKTAVEELNSFPLPTPFWKNGSLESTYWSTINNDFIKNI